LRDRDYSEARNDGEIETTRARAASDCADSDERDRPGQGSIPGEAPEDLHKISAGN